MPPALPPPVKSGVVVVAAPVPVEAESVEGEVEDPPVDITLPEPVPEGESRRVCSWAENTREVAFTRVTLLGRPYTEMGEVEVASVRVEGYRVVAPPPDVEEEEVEDELDTLVPLPLEAAAVLEEEEEIEARREGGPVSTAG